MTLETNLLAMYYQQSVGGGRPPSPPGPPEPAPPDDEIWYTAPKKATLYSSTNVESHTYVDGHGVVKYVSALTTIPNTLRGSVITAVSFPRSATTIASYAFSGSNLEAVVLPANITKVNNGAFALCKSLATVTFKASSASIGSNSFFTTASLLDIYVPWGEGEVASAPWGATNATIHYNSTQA